MRAPAGLLAARGIIAAGALVVTAAACGPSGPTEAERRRAALELEAGALLERLEENGAAPPAGALRVRLAFGTDADLDLYVTDPLHETVYFANSPSRGGGELERDVRCDAGEPRIETVTFLEPVPGFYRIGVDFPEHCAERREAVAFALRTEHDGESEESRGAIEPLHFLPIVLETRVPR